MNQIVSIAKKYSLHVIEDNAQAIGSEYTLNDGSVVKTGTIGDIGCTSFFPSKNLGCFGDGGAICTNNDDLAEKMRMIANHGQSKKYHHDVVGCNSRLDNLQAGILRIKLRELDSYLNARRTAASYYDTVFNEVEGIQIPFRSSESKHVFHQYTLILEGIDRDDLHDFLAEKEIPSMIYYPIPAHRQKMFESFDSKSSSLPITDWLTDRVISLPMHTELEEDQLKYISQTVLEFVDNKIKVDE